MQAGAQQWDGGGVDGGAQQWDAGGVGGGAQQWNRDGVGGSEPLWGGGGMGSGVQEGGVPGLPDPEGGGAHLGRPLCSTIDSQAPASREQQFEWPTFFVTH